MLSKKFDLTNKTALITGGAGLLGLEHAKALLESGASVILTDIDKKSLLKASETLSNNFASERIETYLMDITQIDQIQSVALSINSKKTRVDILINNAAVDPKVDNSNAISNTSRLENFSLKEWNYQLNVGLTGAFLCSQIFGDQMAKDEKGGVILNIASDLSVIAPDQRIYRKADLSADAQPVKPVTYSVIKAGLVGLTKYLATYWADKGVRSNALSPGGVLNKQDLAFVQSISNLIPLGRMAEQTEYRSAVQFLCSDASSYMTGQNIVIDGGRSIW